MFIVQGVLYIPSCKLTYPYTPLGTITHNITCHPILPTIAYHYMLLHTAAYYDIPPDAMECNYRTGCNRPRHASHAPQSHAKTEHGCASNQRSVFLARVQTSSKGRNTPKFRHCYPTTLLKNTLISDVFDLLIFIVAQPFALVEVSLQGVRLCGIGAGHTYPNINQRIRK